MAVYLAQPISGVSNHPLFRQRKISGATQGPLSNCPVFGVTFERQLAYDGYRANIDIFVAATNRQMKLKTSVKGALLSNPSRPVLPISHPKLVMQPKVKMSNAQLDQLMQRISASNPEKVQMGTDVRIIMHNPLPHHIDAALRASASSVVCMRDEISPRGSVVFRHILHCISEFLCVNSYPAFVTGTGDDNQSGDKMDLDTVLTVNVVTDIKKRWMTDEEQEVRDMERKRQKGKDGKAIEKPAEDDEEMGSDDGMSLDDVIVDVTPGKAKDAVLTAKPSPIPLEFNFGSPSEVPGNLPGRAFPYFDGMNVPDQTSLRDSFRELFFRTLGDSMSEIRETWKMMKTGIDSLARTSQGMAMSHMLYGIKLALSTQTRMFVVMHDGEYLGFVLLGARFAIWDGQEWMTESTPEELFDVVSSMTTHREALANICATLTSCPMKVSGLRQDVPIASIRCSADLWDAIAVRKVEDGAKDTLLENLGLVRFGRGYKRILPSNVNWALDLLLDESKPIPRDTNLFLSAALELYDHRDFRIFCTFGPDAFSLVNTAGARVPIPPYKPDVTPSVDVNADPKQILISTKGVKACYQDWQKVVKEKAIYQNDRERARANRNLLVKGDDRLMILQTLASGLTKADAPPRGEKRKAEGEGDRAAKRRADASGLTSDDILSLF